MSSDPLASNDRAVRAVAEWLADDADSWGRADPRWQMDKARSILAAVDEALTAPARESSES